MKQLITLFAVLVIFGFTPLYAKKVTFEQAHKQACAFWNTTMTKKQKSYRIKSIESKTNSSYYIFNNEDKGFVIIAGSDAVPTVLGYCTSSNFDPNNVPEGLQALLDNYKLQIEYLEKNSAPSTNFSTPSVTTINAKKLPTALWNQNAPYNKYIYNEYPTGCVATSMAIVMRYHKYPEKGTGSYSYEYNGQNYYADFSKSHYNWDNMPTENASSNTIDKYDGIAKLMSDCGISTHTYYLKRGSSASFDNICNALIKYFGYSPLANYQYMSAYDTNAWNNKLKDEINANRPVIYGADEKDERHTFVIDGYNEQNMFSINWGWGGAYNGYFSLGKLSPYEGANFHLYQCGIFFLQAATGNEKVCPIKIAKQKDEFYGANMNVTDVKANEDFQVYVNAILCQSTEENGFSGSIHAALHDSKGNIKEWLTEGNRAFAVSNWEKGLSLSNSLTLNCNSKIDAQPGDYITFYTKTKNGEITKILGFDNTEIKLSATNFVPLTTELKQNNNPNATVEIKKHAFINLYKDKILQGSTIYYNVVVAKNIQKYFVFQDSKAPSVTSFGDGSEFYVIQNANKTSYNIEIKTYENYEEKDFYVTSTAGYLKEKLENLNLDYLIYSRIKILGEIDQQDFEVLNNMAFSSIDLSDCHVAEYEQYGADEIPAYAFRNNSYLKHFKLPKQIKRLGYNAFQNTLLEEIDIPSSINFIGLNTFWGCSQLANVTMHWENPINISWCVFKYGPSKRILHIPTGTKSTYTSNSSFINNWGMNFSDIIEDAPTSIKYPTLEENSKSKAVTYTLDGKVIEKIKKGNLYIKNGKKIIAQ